MYGTAAVERERRPASFGRQFLLASYKLCPTRCLLSDNHLLPGQPSPASGIHLRDYQFRAVRSQTV